MSKQHVPHMCLKPGICKKSDSERIRRNAGKNLSLLLNAVCDDWNVPHIPYSWCNISRFYGQFTITTLRGVRSYSIQVSSIAYFETPDSRNPFFQRKQLVETILHELAHYIQTLMYGCTDHGAVFEEILETLRATDYPAKLTEIV